MYIWFLREKNTDEEFRRGRLRWFMFTNQFDNHISVWAVTLAARGLEEHVQITLIFRESSFHVIYCVTLAFMYFFWRISDSRFSWIHDFKELLTKSIGPVPFSAEYLICRDVWTDELIRVELGNLIGSSSLSAQYQSDAKWVGKQKGILHFCLNSIVKKLFIIRRFCTGLNHGLSGWIFFSRQNLLCTFGKIQS